MDNRQLATIYVAFICGATIGGLLATCLWFRWYLNGGTLETPVFDRARREWGEPL